MSVLQNLTLYQTCIYQRLSASSGDKVMFFILQVIDIYKFYFKIQ